MTSMRWTTAFALIGFAAAPLAAQQMRMGASGQEGGGMDPEMMRMCHAMTGGDEGMGGHAMMGGQGMMGGRGMMGGHGMMGMMQGMRSGPAALLGAAEPLGLTPDQKTRLERIAETAAEGRRPHMDAATAAHRKAAEALKGDSPDLDAYQGALQEAADHTVQAHVAMTRASLDARAVLTPEQRTKLQEGMTSMGSMTCGMMGEGGGMRGASTPRGGPERHHERD